MAAVAAAEVASADAKATIDGLCLQWQQRLIQAFNAGDWSTAHTCAARVKVLQPGNPLVSECEALLARKLRYLASAGEGDDDEAGAASSDGDEAQGSGGSGSDSGSDSASDKYSSGSDGDESDDSSAAESDADASSGESSSDEDEGGTEGSGSAEDTESGDASDAAVDDSSSLLAGLAAAGVQAKPSAASGCSTAAGADNSPSVRDAGAGRGGSSRPPAGAGAAAKPPPTALRLDAGSQGMNREERGQLRQRMAQELEAQRARLAEERLLAADPLMRSLVAANRGGDH